MTDEPGKKLEVGLNRGLPHLLYTHQWKRVDPFVDEVADEADISRDELGERIEEDGPFADVFWTASERIAKTTDTDYRDVLGRLVAAALDPAKIQESDYLVAQLCRLEPLHVRVLLHGFTFWDREIRANTTEGEQVEPQAAVWAGSRNFSRRDLEQKLSLSFALAQSAIDVLVATGFLMRYDEPSMRIIDGGSPANADRPQFKTDGRWTPTPWARAAIGHIFPNVADTD